MKPKPKQVEPHIFKNEQTKLYNVRVVVTPYTRKASGLSTIGAARSKVFEFKSELRTLRDTRSKGIVTFSEAITQFIEHRGSRYKAAGLYSMKAALAKHTSKWSSVLVNEIKREHVETLGNKMMTEIKPVTVDRNLRYIRAVFTYLVEMGTLDRNPTVGVRFSKGKYARKLTAMNRQDVQRLLDHTRMTNHSLDPFFRLAYFTGARSGELKELRCKDYNREGRLLTISRSYDHKAKIVGPTKSGRSRVVPLPIQAIELIERLLKGKSAEDTILPFDKNFMRGQASAELRSIQRSMGISECNFHSLRATFITQLLLSGQPVATVQELVGHADMKTTQAYVRLCASDLKGSTDALALSNADETTTAKVDILAAIMDL